MSKFTAICLFYERDALEQQLVDVNNKLKAARQQYYKDRRQALPTMEGFRKEVTL